MKERSIIESRKLLANTPLYSAQERKGKTVFQGCQCFKDCFCHDDFESVSFTDIRIRTKTEPRKTYYVSSIEKLNKKLTELKLL